MAKINDYKKEATLNKTYRYDEGIMTRRDWLKLMNVKGWQAEERTRRNHAAEDKLFTWCEDQKMIVPLGNPNYPATKHYLEEKARLTKGIFKTEYVLVNGNSVYDLTKTEYDYFKGLQLAEDKATEAMELTSKIEAGTATNEEIEQDEQKEFEIDGIVGHQDARFPFLCCRKRSK